MPDSNWWPRNKMWDKHFFGPSAANGDPDRYYNTIESSYGKMQGVKRATQWGYSLFEFGIYGKTKKAADLSTVHFIKLLLKDEQGRLLSDNFYWRSGKSADYTDLNKLPRASLQTSSTISTKDQKSVISTTIKNVGNGVAFAIHVQAVRAADGERILPATMSDNYFTLMKGETKNIIINFDESLLKDGKYQLLIEPYNK